MKKIAITLTLFILFLAAGTGIEAKVLPQAGKAKAPVRTGGGGGGSPGISAKMRGDRQALNLFVSNLRSARGVSYILTYQTNGIDQGVGGSLDSSAGASASREIYFGTCSSGVCRPHTGLSNMKLEVTSELSSGRKVVKRFRIKI